VIIFSAISRAVPAYRADWRGILIRKTNPELEESVAGDLFDLGSPGAEYRERPAMSGTSLLD
jgi:hypothetical protein